MSLAALIDDSKKNSEAWRFTKLTPFASVVYQPAMPVSLPALPEPLTRHRLVFVDGVYHEELSAHADLPDNLFTHHPPSQADYTLTLSGQTCLAIDPIELLFVNTDQPSPNETETHIALSLGENSRLTLIENHLDLGAKATNARHVRLTISLGPQSKLIMGKIISGSPATLHISQTDVTVASGAYYDHFGLTVGGKLVRCEHAISLQGELAETRLLGVMLLDHNDQADMISKVTHESPLTSSRQLCKTVAKGASHGVFQGKIYVNKEAQKTDGYQLSRALLLSDQARMDAKPELEIYADDVKCSHGSTVGDLDEQALFYLLSRGIPPQSARAMLVSAFVQELIDMCPSRDIARAAQEKALAWSDQA